MLLMIDNYDSFTYNLVHYLEELGEEVVVRRNDAIDIAGIRALGPDRLMISPGPGRPEDAGISLAAIEAFSGKIPLFGVCLGQQCIVEALGGRTVKAAKVMHGKTSDIEHTGEGVFAGLDNPLTVTRYHSLVAEAASLPAELVVTARTREGEIMGVRHRQWALEGVQFHPESVKTRQGHELLENFLRTGE